MCRTLRRAACLLAVALAGCASLPGEVARPPSAAFTDTQDTRLGRALEQRVAAHPGNSGVLALQSAREAFAARVLLARSADRSIDAQYYIWHDDTTGRLLFEELWNAAERGVRVRLLLDDINTGGLDPTLAVLASRPGIEIRLFNPFANRGWRAGDYLGDFSRINRRMHNKSFTVDNQASIVGGRNIGDEYFGAHGSDEQFADLDVLVGGGVVGAVSQEFDAYWNCAAAYPVTALIPPATPEQIEHVRTGWSALRGDPAALDYFEAVRETPLVPRFIDGTVDLEWVPARVVADDPGKVLNPPDRHELHMLEHLQEALGRPDKELDLVSPYFVPVKAGTEALRALADRGVQVRVLTNSLSATDVTVVYAGYSKYREDLLRGGNISLYEFKRAAGKPPETAERDRQGVGGSSGADESLHAKTFAVDRQRIFVGSFNLDPRSVRLNTEMGVVLDSPRLAGRLAQAFDEVIPREQYEVRLTGDGEAVEWIERGPDGETRHDAAPATSVWRRMWSGFLSVLPLDWLL
jgi:putative cardiolipin synthase